MYIQRWGLVIGFLALIGFAHPSGAKDVTISATEWPPFTSENLQDGGFMIDITRRAFQEMGYGVDVKIVPWKRALRGTKTGHYDVLVGASFTEERTAFFDYPTWHFPNDIALFTSAGGKDSYAELSDLCPARVGVLNGSYLIDFLSKTSCLEIVPIDNTQDFFKMTRGGRIDMFADNAVSIRHMFAKGNFKAKQIYPPLLSDGIYSVISKKTTQPKRLLKDLEAGFKKLEKSGVLVEIFKRYGIKIN